MTILTLALGAALGLAAPAAPVAPVVSAAAGPNLTADPQRIAAALQTEGYSAKLGTDGDGDPMITSGYSGSEFRVYFYNCTEHRACTTIQFYAGYHLDKPVTVATINEWNRTRRFGRGYIDKQNDPAVEMDLDLDMGGISPALFKDQLEVWTETMARFQKHIGFD